MTVEAPADLPAALSASAVNKAFGENVALNGVSLDIPAGAVHALVGMNGSGKSTMVKILAGFYQRDSGDIEVGGFSDNFSDRIAFVHQDLALVESMSVLENLSLGRHVPTAGGRIDRPTERKAVAAALTPFQLEDRIDDLVADLTKAEKTIVAIARALQARDESSLLVLDEPTSTLPARETQRLLDVAKQCAKSGLGVLFISHRLAEVMRVSDHVTVLRNGAAVACRPTETVTIDDIVGAMGGTDIKPKGAVGTDVPGDQHLADAPDVLAVRGLTGETLNGVDLTVRQGEVLGIAGVLGSGVEELGALLSGRAVPTAGEVCLSDVAVTRNRSAVGFVPANRASQAVLAGLSARENATISDHRPYLGRGRINVGKERRAMHRWFETMAVHPLDTEADMLSLSGGNQQKVLMARWLSVEPDLIVADEPTQGVDVYAKGEILAKLRAHAARGLTVVLITGEPEEIAWACDRMVVINSGLVSEEFNSPIDPSTVLAEMHKGDIHGHG